MYINFAVQAYWWRGYKQRYLLHIPAAGTRLRVNKLKIDVCIHEARDSEGDVFRMGRRESR